MVHKRELTDLSLIFHRETEKAIHVSETGDNKDAVWLPKSQIEYEVKKGKLEEGQYALVEVTLPTWLASEKKFKGY